MNVVDSSAWLEYFANRPNAAFFAPSIEQVEKLLVPAIVLLITRILAHRARVRDPAQRSRSPPLRRPRSHTPTVAAPPHP